MKNLSEDCQVWFLAGSQQLYGDQALAQVQANAKALVETLNQADLPAHVVCQPVLTNRESVLATILKANADPHCVGVITWMHTFSPAKMWIGGLNALRLPLCHLHTQVNRDLPWATIDMDFMNLHQAAHGDREFAHILTRLGIRRTTVAGHLSNPAVTERLSTWLRAAIAAADTRRGTVVRFGDNMRDVAVTEGDKVEAEAVFGVNTTTYGVNDLVAEVSRVSQAEASALADSYCAAYQVAGELAPGGDRHDSLVEAAKQEIALRRFLEQTQATAFTTNFEDLGGLRQLPGLAVQRLMAEGYGFGAEGDWKTALMVRAAKVMGQGLAGGASLMEDYTYHLVPGEEKILGAHMLEICPTLTSGRPALEIHPLGIGNREDPVRLVFTADPGPAVVIGLADLGHRFRLTCNQVTLVPADQPMPRLPVARALWQPQPDFATSAGCWLASGAPHHTALSSAIGLEAVEDYATIMGVELAIIDQATTIRQFDDRLRLNEAYFR